MYFNFFHFFFNSSYKSVNLDIFTSYCPLSFLLPVPLKFYFSISHSLFLYVTNGFTRIHCISLIVRLFTRAQVASKSFKRCSTPVSGD